MTSDHEILTVGGYGEVGATHGGPSPRKHANELRDFAISDVDTIARRL